MHNNEIIYQDSSFCLSCWHHQRPPIQLEKPAENMFENIRETREKKISLKRPHKHTRRPNSEQIETLKASVIGSAHPQTHRGTTEIQNEQHVRFSYQTDVIRPTVSAWLDPANKRQELRPHSHPGTDQQLDYKVIENGTKNPFMRNLKETTKVSQTGIESSEELVKTKKTTSFGKSSVFQFRNLKASVYSINEGQIRERMQESQIILDFFNPNQRKLQQLQRIIGKQSIRQEQSFTLSPEGY